MSEVREQPSPRTLTPLRRQYLRVKKQYPDAILLFRLGDFYETFDADAEIAARELEITLTSREMGKGQRVPMAGIPYHALDSYLARLVKKGHKVAICEQLTDPSQARGLVERDVVRVVTPGTVLEPALLEQKASNYLTVVVWEAATPSPSPRGRGDGLTRERRGLVGLAYADVSTGEFAATELPLEHAALELERLAPAEVLVAKDDHDLDGLAFAKLVLRQAQDERGNGPAVTELEPEDVDLELARERLHEHFGVSTLAGFGLEGMPQATRAAGALVAYLARTQKAALGLLTSLGVYSTERAVPLDPQTRRNLELFQGGRTGRSLLSELDETRTAMGARLLRAWLGRPLTDLGDLRRRQDAVQWFSDRGLGRDRARKVLGRIGDIERMVGRVQAGVAQPRELVALRQSLEAMPELREAMERDSARPELVEGRTEQTPQPAPPPLRGESGIKWLMDGVRPCDEVVALLARAIVDEPGPPVGEGGVIREGFSPELDEVRRASRDARGYLAGLEQRERERTGIPSLKVGYNRVFGYYLEVTKPHLAKVPPDFIRRQTLVNGERFITPELKEHEATVLGAQERMAELEAALFRQVCAQVAGSAPPLLATARAVAQVDVFSALAHLAVQRAYCRPFLTEDTTIRIKGGRHPVVERVLPQGTFVPNDVELGGPREAPVLILLTGPNMGGKSTYLRQVALIVLMAQVGSFVPAEEAEIGLVDRIFTRVGLQDDLATGMSTFMVEMVEVAQILNNATPRSLVVLDEIGRGTSTYDGLAIACAVAEHLHSNPRLGCRTLFATHYHELTELADTLPRVTNYHVSAMEQEGRVVFLHRVESGGADRSYGVHVAQLAGLPRVVVNRARDVLQELENGQSTDSRRLRRFEGKGKRRVKSDEQGAGQLPLLPLDVTEHPVLKALAHLDVNGMTPLEALNMLWELQRRAKDAEDPAAAPP